MKDWPGVTVPGTSSIDTPAETALLPDDEAPLLPEPLDDAAPLLLELPDDAAPPLPELLDEEVPPLLLLDEAPLEDAPDEDTPPLPLPLEQPVNAGPAAISNAKAARGNISELVILFTNMLPERAMDDPEQLLHSFPVYVAGTCRFEANLHQVVTTLSRPGG